MKKIFKDDAFLDEREKLYSIIILGLSQNTNHTNIKQKKVIIGGYFFYNPFDYSIRDGRLLHHNGSYQKIDGSMHDNKLILMGENALGHSQNEWRYELAKKEKFFEGIMTKGLSKKCIEILAKVTSINQEEIFSQLSNTK